MPDALPRDDVALPQSDPRQTRTLKRVGIGAALVAVAVIAFGISQRSAADRQLTADAAASAVPTVEVVFPRRGDAGDGLALPGSVQAFNSAAIYARTNGYVRRWLVDIGDRVRAGQTLAVLDAPEVDQQLAQALADYQTALANARLARTTSERWSVMLHKDAVSRQEADEKAGDYAAKLAVANAALANVKRLRAMQGFERLSAPFAGTVTSRSAQIGALVVANNASAQPLFTVSDTHRVRVYVKVPQNYSAQVHPGMHIALTLPEYPGRSFDAVLTRTAGAVDVSSGAVLVEAQADNGGGELKPGAYAQVKIPVAAGGNLTVPASTLIFREAGPVVAVVDGAGRVTLRPVTIGRDQGKVVEISSGLSARDRVVDTPPDALDTGDMVTVRRGAAHDAA